MVKGRDILIYLSLKYEGEWDKIYAAIQNRAHLDMDDFDKVLAKLNTKVTTILDKDYPKQFSLIPKPPFALYYYGDLSLLSNPDKCLSVIGSRSNTTYGKEMTELLVKGVADKLVIVSGMARGIDGIAQEAAINNGGHSVAILGSGIDYCYPKRNEDLYNKLKASHLVISEYPGKVAPKPNYFIDRNRLIGAASSKTLVVEAKYRSGTVSTVNYALQYGRDVMCVPSRANEESMCNRLIKEGAPMIETVYDLEDEYYYIFK